MKKSIISPSVAIAFIALANPLATKAQSTYQADLDFLKKHTEIIELTQGACRVAIAPSWQGRVMTSTVDGPEGAPFGWISRENIATGIVPEEKRQGLQKHIHIFGGEERFWLGPEGGEFALFFAPKVAQSFDNWKTPAAIDTEPFDVVERREDRVAFARNISVPNRAGSTLAMRVNRNISLLDLPAIASALAFDVASEGIRAVGYQTENTVTNTGTFKWTRETGAPSIWLLGMFNPTPGTTIVIPYRPGSEAELGNVVNTNYEGFGQIPPERVKLSGSVLYFKGDGKARGKLGIKPKRATGWAGSWQADSGVLTLVKAGLPTTSPANTWPYVDSQWIEKGAPFDGDAINSYNDGPPTPGAAPLGPFFELESSSPALLLAPGESYTHTQQTFHVTGPKAALDAIARRTLSAGLDEIQDALQAN